MIKVDFTAGTVIRLMREQKGMGQESFGMDKASLSKIELGHRVPRPETLEKIANQLGVTTGEIFEYVDRLNSLNTEQVDGERLRLHRKLDDLLDAGGELSIATKVNIESLYEKVASQQESAKKQAADAAIQKEAIA